MSGMGSRIPHILAPVLLLVFIGGCNNTAGPERAGAMQPMAIAQPVDIAAQPASPQAPARTRSIKPYRQRLQSFDGALTRAEQDAVVWELKGDIARHEAARNQ